ncbi:MAG: hypothetical protein JRH01_00405 [Deltaproteobacteria bacterium]|nr:hypothetical protein [Deltaproteobacteria bacterium]
MLQRIRSLVVFAVALQGVLILLPASSAQATQIGFTSGLAGWTTQGGVQAQAGIATLTDTSGFLASLYRPTATTPGAGYRLEFDISLGLSSGLPQLGFPDTTFVTLYQTNDLGSFSLAPGGALSALSVATWNSGGLLPGGGGATSRFRPRSSRPRPIAGWGSNSDCFCPCS